MEKSSEIEILVASFKIITDSLSPNRQIQVFTKTGKNDSYHLHH